MRSDFWLEIYSAILRQFPPAARCHRWPVNRAPDSWKNDLLLILITCYIFFYKKKYMTFDSNYFEAIQAAGFYKKNASKIIRSSSFLLHISRPSGVLWPKSKLTFKRCPKNMVGWIVEALESVKDCGQFHVFVTFLKYFFIVLQGHFTAIFSRIWDLIIETVISKLLFCFIF